MPTMTRRSVSWILGTGLLALLLGLLACSPQKALWQSGIRIPGLLEKPMRVESVTERGDFLAATLAADDFSFAVYLPSNDACRALFVEGAVLNYLEGSPGGTYKKDGWTCFSAGIGTLHEWRSRLPRPTGSPIPRGHASYQLVYQDAEVAFLRGRFPLVGRIGFVEHGDTIAVLSKTPDCEGPIARTTSTMEYYSSGKRVLTLVSSRGQCPIIGLINPFG